MNLNRITHLKLLLRIMKTSRETGTPMNVWNLDIQAMEAAIQELDKNPAEA